MGGYPTFPNWSFVEIPRLLCHVLSGFVVEEHHTIAKKIGTFLPDGPSQDFQRGEVAAVLNSASMLQEVYQP
jgi:riboflavin transporter FmnP